MAKRGRTAKEVDKEIFEALLHVGAPRGVIVDYFDWKMRTKSDGEEGITDASVDRWCKRTYGCNFAEMIKKGDASRIVTILQNQMSLSKKSASMAIYLGKVYCGQSDEPSVNVEQKDESMKAMGEYFADKKRNT